MKNIFKLMGRILIILLITVVFVFITLLITIRLICSDISQGAKELFATTFLETGQMKFMVSMFLSNDEIQELVHGNSVQAMATEMDTNLINTNAEIVDEEFDENGIRIEEISGNAFFAKMLIIKDPSKVKLRNNISMDRVRC